MAGSLIEGSPLTVIAFGQKKSVTATMSGKAALFCGALVATAALSTASVAEGVDYSFLAELVKKVADFDTMEDDAAEGIYQQLKDIKNSGINK